MSMFGLMRTADISASGMSAERLRMEVGANNLANAHTTRGPDDQPFRRQQVVFHAAGEGLGGVEVAGLQTDMSELPQVHQPNHPDADENGFVTLTNVNVAFEMVDLLTASRSYEANLRSLRTFREMAEQALGLLRGT